MGTPTAAFGTIAGLAAGWVLAGTLIAVIPAWVAIHLNTARILAQEEL